MKNMIFKLVLFFSIFNLSMISFVNAQSNSSDLIYKFSVNGITNVTPAKQVQVLLLQQPNMILCKFIDECDCFKLTTNDFVSYELLRNILLFNGYQLLGDISLSDGRILKEKIAPQNQTK